MIYPIGIQSFPEIIRRGLAYVDKTALVHDLANTVKSVFLSRPRRCGTSLLVSTLASSFDGEKELFRGR
ncbi:MAG: AAA family ATPase, partial [Sutterellaceae bacterium]|nr:AAA family ATPase [Sutterellaceae bacterium]